MNIIAATDNHWGIGKDGELLYRIPEDMRFFREKTLGKVVVMGHSTFQSLPGARPLSDRINVVLTRRDDLKIAGCRVVSGDNSNIYRKLSETLRIYPTEDVFIIGGGKIYSLLLDHCRYAYVTKIHADGKADVFLPNLDMMKNWSLAEQSGMKEYQGLAFSFCLYRNAEVL